MSGHAVGNRNRWQPSAQLVFQVAKGLKEIPEKSQGLRGMNRLRYGGSAVAKENRTRRGAAWRLAAFAPRLPTSQLLVSNLESRILEFSTTTRRKVRIRPFEFALGIEVVARWLASRFPVSNWMEVNGP